MMKTGDIIEDNLNCKCIHVEFELLCNKVHINRF